MCRHSDPEEDVVRMHAAITDVIPPFRKQIDRQLRESTMLAGQLTRLTAQALDREVNQEELNRRVVGVQLIYEGLNLTRALVRFPPWEDEPVTDADVKILIADVLVARGFSLLTGTEATSKAITTIRRFARHETNRSATVPESDLADRALEADVFEISIVAGVTATGANRPTGTQEFAMALAESLDDEISDEAPRFSMSVVDELEEFVCQ